MKITKKIEAEILQVIDNYWDSYFQGDLQSWAAYLPEDYRNIGTTKAEIWNSKKEIVDFTESIIDQTVGMAEVRDKKTQIIPYEPYVMVHELGDLYVKAEEGWVFYAQFRLSSLLGKTKDGWKILHQHGSYPDSKTDEGEAFGFDELKAENKKLRDAIRARTIDLERKNRELEIESSLERVRAVAMSMKNSKELQAVSEVIFKELITLGYSDLRNTEIIINQDEKQSILSYYYSDYGVTGEVEVDYTAHPTLKKWAEDMKNAGDGFASVHISEDEMEGWKQYRLDLGYLPDPKLKKAKTLDYYSYSTGLGAISISSFEPISDDQLATLERFRNVFGLAYRRYLDVVHAEAQAREAQIEAALEKVRSRSLAVNKSDEFNEVVGVVFKKLSELNIPVGSVTIALTKKDSKDWEVYGCGEGESGLALIKFSLPYFPNAFSDDILAAQSSNDSGYFSKVYSEAQKNEYYEFAFKNTELKNLPDDLKQIVWQSTSYGLSVAYTKNSILMVNEFEGKVLDDDQANILKRFSKVFEQAYIRFLDLQRAEAQAREAQIEAALERVRSRSMAMHKSEELSDVANVLFEQLRNLGGNLWGTGFAFCQTNSDQDEFWFVNQGGTLPTVYIPNNEDPIHRKMYEGWKDKLDLYSEAKGGAELKAHYEYMLSVPSVKGIFQGMLDSGLSFPEWQKWHAAYFSHGYLLIITVEPYKEEQVFTRFAKVFDQAYTRFLDLQKAEAQAREARIEAALERVRSRSMAMHESTEIQEVTNAVFNNLLDLGVSTDTATILIPIEGSKDFELWIQNKEGNYTTKVLMPYQNHKISKDFLKAAQKRLEIFTANYDKKQKDSFFQFFFSHPDALAGIPEERKSYVLDGEAYSISLSFNAHTGMQIGRYTNEAFSKADNSILQRFAHVFEQTYIRFLDLLKAEAQAREAQIEAALERVRARTMAMHHSHELAGVMQSTITQLQGLDIKMDVCAINLLSDTKDWHIWVASPEQNYAQEVHIPFFKHPLFRKSIEARKNQGQVTSIELNSNQLTRWYEHIFNHSAFGKLTNKRRKKVLLGAKSGVMTIAMGDYSFLLVGKLNSTKFLKEDLKIFKRFSQVFDQAYTRFLDLQRAEAQARESQIEAALERLRAKAMSMHHSDELDEVLAVLCEQFDVLGIVPMSAHLTVLDIENNKFTFRETGKYGNRSFGEQTVALDAMDTWKEMVESWHNAEPFSINRLHFPKETLPQVWEVFHESFASMPEDSRITPEDYPDGIYHTAGKHPFGYIGMNQIRKATEEEEQIVVKFANEFGRAYQRFLDLQNAEAQAREAEIEVALERVRAKGLAMHHTDELEDIVHIVFEQLLKLAIPIGFSSIGINEYDSKDMNFWVAAGDNIYTRKLHVPFIDHPIHTKILEAFTNGVPFLSDIYSLEEMRGYYEHVFRHPEYRGFPEERKQLILSSRGYFRSAAISKYTTLTIGNYRAYTYSKEENEILKRFGKVFEQTYTRFLDLQKAEAQAREAQIEAALERVRSRTMAMHNSHELNEVVSVMYDNMQSLGLAKWGCNIIICHKEKEEFEFWLAESTAYNHTSNYFVDSNGHPVYRNIWKHWEAQGPPLTLHHQNEYKREFDEYWLNETDFKNLPDEVRASVFDKNEVFLNYATMRHGLLNAISFEQPSDELMEALDRFAKVFEQAYTRFLDLQRAEAQAREAQIEAALERVRAKSMAMHKSEDLADLSLELVKQVQNLGIDTWFCAFNINEGDELGGLEWGSNGQDVFPKYRTPREGIFLEYHKASQRGEKLYIREINEEECPGHYEYLCSLPGVGEQLLKMKEGGISFPTYQIDHVAFFKYGYILFITFEPVPESHETFKRFAKVFEQTYTRFLDLQRAEEQAREAQIEAALERVRAQTMAMHNSEDVGKSIVKMFEELTALGVPESTRFGIGILNHDNTNNQLWTAKKIGEEVNMHIGNLDMTLHPLLESARKAWKKQVPLHKYILKGEDLLNYYRILNNAPDYELKVAMDKLPEREFHYGFVFDHGFFYAFSPHEFETELIRITQRFSALFAQTYRRYLDLVKAEAQAREAEIELALERVRAKTMAMHNSEELLETGAILFKELSKLGVKIFNCGYVLMDDKAKMGWNYGVNPGDGTIRALPTGIPQSGTKVLDAITESWKKQEPLLVIELDPQETIQHQTYIAENAPNFSLTKEQLLALTPEQLVIQTFNFKHGYLLLVDGVKLTTDQREMVTRFANVFEMTYRRFLDLKKAEAQAREAQIEAAVERVRAEAMAMHTSEDFSRVNEVLWEQVKKLEVTGFAGAGIVLFSSDEHITYWDISSAGNIGQHWRRMVQYEYKKYPLLGLEFWEAYQKGKSYFILEYDLDRLKAGAKEWASIDHTIAAEFAEAIAAGQLTHLWGGCGRITNGFLTFNHLQPPDEDAKNILGKMASAFELAYQRFLDLQKAEAQAREKEIELGLERVRARAMGMRNSEELADLVKTVFDELTKLDFSMKWCMINIIDEATADNEIWAVNPDVDKPPMCYNIKFSDWPYHQASFKAYQERKSKFVYVLEGEEKAEFEEFMFNETDVAKISEEAKAATRAMERYVHSYSFSDFGGLQTVSENPLSEESLDILARFGKVFDLTYTRFNDLKLAEAQAREAQIEAALERVRSRSLAMHKTEELGEVVTVVVEKLRELDMSVDEGVALITYVKGSKDLTEWMENPGFPVAMKFSLPYFEHPVLDDLWKAKEEGADFLAAKYNLDESQSFLNHIFEHSDFKHTPQEIKDYCLSAEAYGYSIAFQENTSIFVNHYSGQSLSEQEVNILKRFSKVFEQAYTRFLDLQKAETQARESQIEAAMERVRARAMAMQKAEELVDVAAVLRKEMGLLGVEELETSSIYIYNEKTGKTECWYSIQDNEKKENLISDHMVIDLNDTWVGQQMLQFYHSDEVKTSIIMQGSNRSEWINYCAEQSDLFSVTEFYGEVVPERTYHLYKFSNGYMGAASPGEISTESWNLLQRATKVFSLAYTRFSDLQMAETQAREAQIELALERGRTQSMLMQHSDELNEVSNVFHEQLLLLGLPSEFSYVWLPDEKKMTHMFWATWSEKKNGAVSSRSKAYTYPLDKTEPYTAACYEMWESEESVFVNRIQPDEVEDFFSTWAELVSEAETLKAELFPDGLYYAEAYMKYGCFGINIRRPLSKEEQDILLRFSVEFERAYTRFLDLKKAEAQTREAQIEASLERVRAQTMAMHDSEDVGQCIVKLFSELITLGVSENTRLGIGILNHDNEDMELWTASKDDDAQVKLDSGRIDMSRHPLLVSARNAWKENRRVDQYIIDGKEQVEAYFQIINTMPDYPLSVNMEKVPNRFVHYDFVFEQGILYAFSPEELSEEMIRIFQRFSALFGQTYRRFLDLQKAEAQAREAKIEAALERVRSRTMAMHKADELHDVVTVVVEKLVDLGVVLDANGVILCTYFPDSRDVLHWIASPDFSFSGSYLLPYFDHPIFSAAWESKLNGDDYFSKSFTVEEKNSFFEYAFEHSDYRHFPEEFKEWVFQNDKHSLSFAWSEHSAILIPSHTGVLPTEADVEILKRFAKVFEQAYVRFMDLQKAEKQAKEALKQAALDRVRGEIASMRSTEDLNRITPVIWRELIALEVPFIRCGVFIVNEESEVVEVYLTTPEGAALGVLNLPFDINSQTTNTVKYWREKKVYHEQWDAQAFTDWTQSMIDLGQVKDFTDYQGASKIPDELHLHFIPFKQGMLYVGDVNPLSDEKIEMVKTLAESFSIAYARYEDFVRLEQAKSEVEVTLEELKSTQAQLIQSEKMASLGELTAGIAHEIQNPLNFVNNFSEVSDEILDEMIEEIEKGDLEEVKAIASDIKQNLQKINHHGKRADAIVKGMLQHSRKSSGEKTPTDINQLADEYLRLAYHGLRAKDKSFNAAFETDFDPDLPMVKVIPQDIGRVLLNLINNAFQAVQEKRQAAAEHYAPKVSVQTLRASDSKQDDGGVRIKIQDNGSGIPDHIKDKIFQPFFTTKPTGEGTGLGLSLSYDIIKAHGGTLEVETKEGAGTTFTIVIPKNK